MGVGKNRVADILKPVVMPNSVAEAVDAIAKVHEKCRTRDKFFMRTYLLLQSECCQYCIDEEWAK